MLELTSSSLAVSLLDPVADLDKLVSPEQAWRYGAGGYIWQVTDRASGRELLTGPQGSVPSSEFNPGQGQGIPDSFQWRPIRQNSRDGPALIIGLGEVESADGAVTSLCSWDISRPTVSSILFKTAHEFERYSLELERTVTLSNRTLRSHTRINNLGSELPFTWYPHPFFPNVGEPGVDELCKFSPDATFVDGRDAEPGFKQDPVSGFISRAQEVGGMGYLGGYDKTRPLTVLQNHPVVGMVAATCSYSPTYLPIWGNEHAFSWEPFLERWLAPGESYEWSIDYVFGMMGGQPARL
jgi:hypothetical protein